MYVYIYYIILHIIHIALLKQRLVMDNIENILNSKKLYFEIFKRRDHNI